MQRNQTGASIAARRATRGDDGQGTEAEGSDIPAAQRQGPTRRHDPAAGDPENRRLGSTKRPTLDGSPVLSPARCDQPWDARGLRVLGLAGARRQTALREGVSGQEIAFGRVLFASHFHEFSGL